MDIIKEAILLERRGKAFYAQVASQARSPEVRNFFEIMAQEEAQHIKVLELQFKSYEQDQRFADFDELDSTPTDQTQSILTAAIEQKISAADFEAAAISAAILMEERAVAIYSGQAQAANDPKEKSLYEWLARWEQGHLSFLAKLDKEIKEAVWHQQDFWPF
jgi:rubrerythrin